MAVAIYEGVQRIVVKTQYSDIFVVEDAIFKAVKADGGLLVYMNVESSDSISLPELEVQQTPSKKSKSQHVRTGKLDMTTSQLSLGSQDNARTFKQRIFSSPLLLYAGPGYVVSHSLLDRRAKFNAHKNITTRLHFDLQRKQNLTLMNPERRKKFELSSASELMEQMIQSSKNEYKRFIPFSKPLQKFLNQQFSVSRMHHEAFLVSSNTKVSPL